MVLFRYSKAGQIPNAQAKRTELDAKVKKLLVMSAAEFTEWLIKQTLVPGKTFSLPSAIHVNCPIFHLRNKVLNQIFVV